MRWAILFLALLLAACASAVPKSEDNGKNRDEARKMVRSLQEVELEVLEQGEDHVVAYIRAQGMASTGGWKDPQLELARERSPREPGYRIYRLTAIPPDGPATQALTPVEATTTATLPTEGWQGVIVQAQEGSMRATVNQTE